jgi:mRNA-degrading endonuclease RelE of RelBE toxin-antitoxin system
MNYRIIPQRTFLRELKRLSKKYRSLKEDLQRLQDELTVNPTAGTDLGGGVRKLRMAIGSKNKGKSHGARVITYTYIVDEKEGVINLLFFI